MTRCRPGIVRLALTAALLAGSAVGVTRSATTEREVTDDPRLAHAVVRGGRLYDNWYLELRERPPATRHPAYPANALPVGDPAETWRCKTCHGWDYRGRYGAYGAGRNFTGIPGIQAAAGASPETVVGILTDATHGYGDLVSPRDLRDLAAFVSYGQVDMQPWIDAESGRFKGDPAAQRALFDTVCANCHGAAGLAMRTIPPLAQVVSDHPYEALHKLLNGHPNEDMPALRVLGVEALVQVLAYAQTLPREDVTASIARGGRLYDNWRLEISGRPPDRVLAGGPADRRHPAYPLHGWYASKPETNWRCKECHGWDYRGRDGAYATGRHYTGIRGIRRMDGADPAAVLARLRDPAHRYDLVLSERDLLDLARFVSRGQVDMARYIDPASKRAKGDPRRHEAWFTTICATCHGLDGAEIPTARPLGLTAREDPWYVLHTMLNGHPNEGMPALRALGDDALADLLAYVQTLPAGR